MRTREQERAVSSGQVSEHVQGRVDPRLQTSLLDALGEPSATGEIGVRPGEAIDAAVLESADTRQVVQISQQTVAVDLGHSVRFSQRKGWHFWNSPRSAGPTTSPFR